MDWFLYDNGLRHDRVKELLNFLVVTVHSMFKKYALDDMKFANQ